KEHSRQLAFGEGWDDNHHGLAGVFRARADDDGRLKRRPGRDADRHAFETGDEARIGDRILVRNGDDLVVNGGIEDLWRKAGAQPLNLVRAGLATRQNGRRLRFHRHDTHGRLALLEHLADTGDGAARADAGDQYVDAAGGVVPDFFGGGGTMDFRVGRVLELLRDDGAGDGGRQFVRLGDGALHALRPLRQHQFGTEQRQHLAALD